MLEKKAYCCCVRFRIVILLLLLLLLFTLLLLLLLFYNFLRAKFGTQIIVIEFLIPQEKLMQYVSKAYCSTQWIK